MTTTPDAINTPAVLERTLERLGFGTPTPVQAAMRVAALAGRDVLALAPTGTGKTLAFGVPTLARLINTPPKSRKGPRGVQFIDPYDRLRALVISPTRELAQQVAKDLAAAAQGSVLRVAVVFGKSQAPPQREAIRNGPDVLVGTPGRLREFIDDGSLSLAGIRIVVIDEADRLADMGFLPQVERILEGVPTPRQVICASATLPPSVESTVLALMRDPVRVEIGQRNAPARASNFRYSVAEADKVALLLTLVKGGKMDGVAVYVRTRRRAGWVATALTRHGVVVALLHGGRSQRCRDQALATFAQGTAQALVATDVAARGLHVPRIKTVVNYDVPLMPEDFVHRVGRAGHSGGAAESFTFVDSFEADEWRRVRDLVPDEPFERELPDISAFARRTPNRGGRTGDAGPPNRPEPKARKRPPGLGDLWRAKKAKRERSAPLTKGAKPGGGVRKPGASRGSH
ncbi:MAG: DEAD/DEAH box helicase [Phycisphaerales bacterium]|nr:DEAD/DEAH box helicase [Phycisphaerales bacterium]